MKDLPAIFVDSLPLLYANDAKLPFKSCDFRDNLLRLYNWNLANGKLANHTKTETLTFKGVIIVDCEMGKMEIVKSQKNPILIINGNLNWVDHVNYKVFKARRRFYKLKSLIPWTTPFKIVFQLFQKWCYLPYYVDVPNGHLIFLAFLKWKFFSNLVSTGVLVKNLKPI